MGGVRRRNGGGISGMGGNEVKRKMGGEEGSEKSVWALHRVKMTRGAVAGGRERERAGYLPVGYFGNTDSRLRAALFKMETAVTRSGSESTSQRL